MEILRKELKLRGETISDLAKKLKVSDTAIYLWMSGKFSPKAIYVKQMVDMGFSEEACLEPSKEIEV